MATRRRQSPSDFALISFCPVLRCSLIRLDEPGTVAADVWVAAICTVEATVLSAYAAILLDLAGEEKRSIRVGTVDGKLERRIGFDCTCERSIATERGINAKRSLDILPGLRQRVERHGGIDISVIIVQCASICGA